MGVAYRSTCAGPSGEQAKHTCFDLEAVRITGRFAKKAQGIPGCGWLGGREGQAEQLGEGSSTVMRHHTQAAVAPRAIAPTAGGWEAALTGRRRALQTGFG